MRLLKQYKPVVLFGIFLVLAILVISQWSTKKPPEPSKLSFRRPVAVPASSADKSQVTQPSPKKPIAQSPQPSPAPAALVEEPAGEEAVKDTAVEVTEEFDPLAAKQEAAAEVKDYNSKLAATLRTINPNARKTRLKAAELIQKADDLEGWIKAKDSGTGMTPEERHEWGAVREVWVNHASELRQVAKRLSATRGTKRKVRILAKEIAERVEE